MIGKSSSRTVSLALAGALSVFLFAGSVPEAQAGCSGCKSAVQAARSALSNQIAKAENNLSEQMTRFQTSLEELLIRISNTLQGEIGKQTQAIRSVQESIATYQVQEELRREAATLSEKLEQPAFVCQTMAMSEGIQDASGATRARSAQFTRTRIDAMLNESSPATRIANSYDRSVTKFCTAFDIATGRCKGDPQIINGDISAAHLFGSASGRGLTYDENQTEAVDAYIERIIGMPPRSLETKCETAQCKAFEEMRKDYAAFVSLPMHSLAEISSAYAPQKGLAARTGTQEVASGEDISMMEAVDAYVRMKFSKDSILASGKAMSSETLLREIAQNQAFRLWMEFNNMRQMERIEAMQAAELAIVGGSHMRQMVEAQRIAALRSAGIEAGQ